MSLISAELHHRKGEIRDGGRPALGAILRRCYFDEFAAGAKKIEYRRHRGQFTARNFRIGRRIVIAYRYDHAKAGLPHLIGVVRSFEVVPAHGSFLAEMQETYPDMQPGDKAALVGLDLVETSPDPTGDRVE